MCSDVIRCKTGLKCIRDPETSYGGGVCLKTGIVGTEVLLIIIFEEMLAICKVFCFDSLTLS